jgi:hypothetical protein
LTLPFAGSVKLLDNPDKCYPKQEQQGNHREAETDMRVKQVLENT